MQPSLPTDDDSFIDMTSHELRNPLSAVIQCADSVIASLHHLSGQQLTALHPDHDLSKAKTEIVSCLEALQIIVSCSMHQKRVIDDVLTLSKLDSNLILITPMRVQPAVVVSDAVRMFEVECNQAGIQLDFKLDETFNGMEWTMLDPSRLLQVLINLLYALPLLQPSNLLTSPVPTPSNSQKIDLKSLSMSPSAGLGLGHLNVGKILLLLTTMRLIYLSLINRNGVRERRPTFGSKSRTRAVV